MAVNSWIPWDAYTLMNELAAQATGQKDLTAVDTSSFVSVGERVLRTGYENTLNSLGTVLGRTIFSIRPYTAKLRIMNATPERWGAATRKVIPLYDGAEASEDFNTEQNPTQLADGQSVDMYKIRNPKVLQLNFYGSKKLQKHVTVYRDQLSLAMRDEAEFMRLAELIMTGYANDMEILNEQKSRGVMVNAIAGASQSGANVVDLVAAYNTRNGTTLTREQLLNKDNITGFMQFLAAQIKVYSKRLTDQLATYHVSTVGDMSTPILRHTPKAYQRMLMYDPIFIEAESMVYSSLFTPSYLSIGDFEGVNFWQNPSDPTAINVTPVILDETSGEAKAGTPTNIPFVLGILYDVEFMGVTPQFEYSSTTPFNSAGGYWNLYNHWRFNSWTDYTENAIVFVLGDGGAPARTSTRTSTK